MTEQDDWRCEMSFDIKATRALYEHICYSIQMWPGAPARPLEEQEFLQSLKTSLFSSIMDYNYTEL